MKTSPANRQPSTFGSSCFLTIVIVLVAAACGSTSNTSTANSPAEAVIQCDNRRPVVVPLLQSGTPTYDYDPAPSLTALIEQSDLVITGTLKSAVRVEGVDDGAGGASWTLIETADHQDLYLSEPGMSREFSDHQSFTLSSNWAERDVADPLAQRVNFESGQTRFVAFLQHTRRAATPWSVLIQGLHIGCGSDPVQSVIEPLPIDEPGSADDLSEAILAIADPTTPRDETQFQSIPYRLLAEDIAAGEPYSTRLIENTADVANEVDEFEIDEDNEVIFEFVLAESGSCDLGSLKRLEFDRASSLLYPVLGPPAEEYESCTADANPHLILVAIASSDLPKGAFSIAMSPDGWPDLWEPTTFESGQLTNPDPASLDIAVLGDPAQLDVGETGLLVDYTTHCGTDYLWTIVNGEQWIRSGSNTASIPSDWRAVERGQQIDLQITLITPDQIDAVARGAETVVTFEPLTDQEEVGCA